MGQADSRIEAGSPMAGRVIEDVAELKDFVGHEVGSSDWFEVDQRLIAAFAELTRDHQWIHVDSARAREESPWGTTIAHGFLTMAMLSHLQAQAVQIRGEFARRINYGFNRVRFPAAVPAGARIRSRSTLQAMEEIEGGLQLTWAVIVEIEGHSRPALAAEWIGRLYR
jgi:acyl dehydratase